MSFVKSVVKSIVPHGLLRLNRRWKLSRLRKTNEARPIKQVFTSIYEQHIWGGTGNEYCSGSGSNDVHASRNATAVNSLIAEKGITSVVDLGCGDFRCGRSLRRDGVRYIGVDIVEGLIRRNDEAYGDEQTSFICLDIVADPLPDGDLCLIRQVLQHLSNAQIATVLQKTRKFRYVLITEHYPSPFVTCSPNLDKPHGPDTRILDDSAVYLDQPPFNVSSQSISLILDTDAETYIAHKGERIKTFLIENQSSD
ncbi:MAG: class I SAM-dependent methyltransferase [Pirellulales bacterium]|nr:class I SAM-dependent methyltransferase [Pirellulales bacterium]